jgi:erythromycin esterase-like protein
MADSADLIHTVAATSQSLTGAPADFDTIVEHAAESTVVLIGEASHGTHDFYRVRAEITKRLIRECGFAGVAVEADWPDAFRVNRYVRGLSEDADADEALGGFLRFPQWMWRSAHVLDFVGL